MNLSDVPVDVPLLHVGESPRGDGRPCGDVDTDQTVVGDAQQLILLTPSESATHTHTHSYTQSHRVTQLAQRFPMC